MGKKREYEDDDGRTIADMSDLHMGSAWKFQKPPKESRQPQPPEADAGRRAGRPWEDYDTMSSDERRYYIFGAMKAGLLIALAFIAGLGLVVLLMLLIWA